MSINKNVFITTLSLMLALAIGTVQAQSIEKNIEEEAILYKIENIIPIKNSEGIVYACDFSLTFFNRTNKTVSGASIDLIWEDNSLNEIIDAENLAQTSVNPRSRGQSQTVKNNPNTLSLSVSIPAMKKLQQTNIKTRIQTDRCFILMSDVKSKVKSCRLEAEGLRASESLSICSNYFRFISPKTQEFYSEFKDITEQKDTREMSRKEKFESEIEQSYSKTVQEFNKASAAISDIK